MDSLKIKKRKAGGFWKGHAQKNSEGQILVADRKADDGARGEKKKLADGI